MTRRKFRNFSRRQFLGASAATLVAACNREAAPGLTRQLPQHPNFVVFLSDTLRADHLPCYGYRKPTAPEIARFAEGAYVFENCHAAATWTLPSTTTVLTGVHPIVHRMAVSEWMDTGKSDGFQHQVLSESISTTAQHLGSRGYQSACFQTNPNASRERGIARGFDHYYYELSAKPGQQMDAVLDWLKNEAQEPFYAYIHLIDPHEPYAADEEAFQRLHGKSILADIDDLPPVEAKRLRDYHQIDWADFYLDDVKLRAEDLIEFSEAGIGHLVDLYDSEIVRVDEAFGRLMAWLEESGVGQRTVTVVTSDHGEAFGEDGQFYHGNFLHDPQTHVPLIIGLPNSRAGLRVPWTVGLCDLHATLLDLAGISAKAPAATTSLVGRDGSPSQTDHRPALSVLDRYNADPGTWEYVLAAGDIRIRGTFDTNTVQVTSLDSGQSPVTLEINDALELQGALRAVGDDTLQLVGQFFRMREGLKQLAAQFPDPTWRQTETFDEAAFRALGYL